MSHWIICVGCNHDKPHWGLGRCKECYVRHLSESRDMHGRKRKTGLCPGCSQFAVLLPADGVCHKCRREGK